MIRVDSALAPNRGRQLFVLIEEGAARKVVPMTPARREIYARWSVSDPTYDFVSAVVTPVSEGSKVLLIRYVMKSDRIPRIENLKLFFPYTKQSHYRLFDIGRIAGFYRNSEKDFNTRELHPEIPHSPTNKKS